jgi:AcrR family transcriptional regulator
MTQSVDMKRPLQERSRRSLERVLAAGIELLAADGYDGFSIEAVSRGSGVSVGSIYQRFPSKAALFAAVQERILERIDAANETMFAGIPVATLGDAAIVKAAVGAVGAHVRRHEPLFRVMILRGAVDEETRRRGSRSSIALARAYEHFILGSVRRFGHRNPDLAADMSFRIVYATLTRRIMSGPTFESETDIDWDTFVTELARSQASYLLAGEG